MPTPLRIEFTGAFYHVIAKGAQKPKHNQKQNKLSDIFHDQEDYQNFIEHIKFVSTAYNLIIHAFCLMTNHIHLFCETPDANLSEAMQRLLTRYKSHYNKKYKRKEGAVFRRRYKAIVVDSDQYAGTLTRYIHQNPVSKLCKSAEDWKYSSYSDYIKEQKLYHFLHKQLVYDSFHSDREEAIRLMVKFQKHRESKQWKPSDYMYGSSILGSENFYNRIKHHIKDKDPSKYIGLSFLQKKDKVSRIKKFIQSIPLNVQLQINCWIYALRTKTGLSTDEISQEVGIKLKSAAITNRVTRLKHKATLDLKIAQVLWDIEQL